MSSCTKNNIVGAIGKEQDFDDEDFFRAECVAESKFTTEVITAFSVAPGAKRFKPSSALLEVGSRESPSLHESLSEILKQNSVRVPKKAQVRRSQACESLLWKKKSQ